MVCAHHFDVVCWCGDKFDHEFESNMYHDQGGLLFALLMMQMRMRCYIYFRMFSLKFFACSLEPSKKSLDSLRVEEAEPYHCGNSLDLLVGIVVRCNIHSEWSFLPDSMQFHSWL